jgi:hypothetical protein
MKPSRIKVRFLQVDGSSPVSGIQQIQTNQVSGVGLIGTIMKSKDGFGKRASKETGLHARGVSGLCVSTRLLERERMAGRILIFTAVTYDKAASGALQVASI